ncbi:MAG: UDP-N-acetylmuramoyl-L-alanyl-D-glutamate--2,6-diaminopimelate ligase [Rhizobiaceae bacterium]|nr:UDP-N-acetylmuramoyl-L-alanyl-D-glutamate--2,6-diaminopimelate ligase [Rhizobiaceae bacterium]
MIELGKLIADLGQLSRTQKQITISNICIDSREVEAGCLFAALPGSKIDGANFVLQAVKNGAAAILVGENFDDEELPVPLIRVNDPRLALAQVAARFFPRQPETMVAVTGTAGKTSVAEFARQLWAGCGRSAAFIGTTGVVSPGREDYGNLTTPDAVTLHKLLDELAGEGVSHAAMEASSHGLDQKRLYGVRLAAAGFTNLGRDHLDYHTGMSDYFDAKMQLFSELLPKGSPAVIFSDDAYSEQANVVAAKAGHEVLSVGRAGGFLTLKRVEHERYSQIAEIVHNRKTYRIRFPLAGDFQISNGLVAAALVLTTGEDIDAVMAGLENLKGASGRLELIGHHKNGAPVYVDYAHKPDALENILKSLRPFASHNLVVVFGCGGDRDPGKRPIMGEIGTRLADKVIVTDDNPRTEDARLVRKAILAAAPGAIEIADRREAIWRAVEELGEGDCLVIAGKGHETGQIVGTQVLEFSDHDEVRKALEASHS